MPTGGVGLLEWKSSGENDRRLGGVFDASLYDESCDARESSVTKETRTQIITKRIVLTLHTQAK